MTACTCCSKWRVPCTVKAKVKKKKKNVRAVFVGEECHAKECIKTNSEDPLVPSSGDKR